MQLANFIAVQPMQDILSQLYRMIVENDAAFGDANDPGAVFFDQFDRMQVDHHANPLAADFPQYIHNALGVFGIERGDGFISQQDPGVLHQSAANRYALHLAAGEVFRPL